MGWSFRRSMSFGGVRLNFSKSGIGYSYGVRGARISTGPRGTYVSIGSNGVYYRQKLDGRTNSPSQPETPTTNAGQIYSAPVESLVDSTSFQMVKLINDHASRFPFAPALAFFGALVTAVASANSIALSISSAVVFSVVFYLTLRLDQRRRTTTLHYDLSTEAARNYERLKAVVGGLAQSDALWRVNSQIKTYDWKRNAGASSLVKRSSFAVGAIRMPFLETNIQPIGFDFGTTKLIFMPDKLFVLERRRYGIIPYSHFFCQSGSTTFIEDGRVPNDAQVVNHTWKFVRKDGGPDRRFSNNRQLPVAQYGELDFRSMQGLHIYAMVSSVVVAMRFCEAFADIRANMSGLLAEGAKSEQGQSRTQAHDQYADKRKKNAEPKRPNTEGQQRRESPKPPTAPPPKSANVILGVRQGATAEEILTAYRNLAKQYHPDVVCHLAPEFKEIAERRMKEINAAYRELRNR